MTKRRNNPYRRMRGGRVLAVASLAALSALTWSTAEPAHAAGVGGIIISEVAPWGSGSSSYTSDWFEVTNTSVVAVDITGWKFDDNSNAFVSSVALNGITSIAAGESVIFMETAVPATTIAAFTASWFPGGAPAGLQVGSYTGSGVGLSTAGDAVNVFNAAGVLQAKVVFGASSAAAPFATFDNGAGLDNVTISTLSVAGVAGGQLVASTPAAIGSPGAIANAGSGGGGTTTTTVAGATTTTVAATTTTVSSALAWPGDQAVQDVSSYVFGGNLSGLIEEPSGTSAPGVLWGVRNGQGTLYRMVWDGTKWAPDTANGWSTGKNLSYTDGTGDPDAEGVTYAGASPSNGIFVSTERNNLNNTVSRLAILRFDPTSAATALTATNDWNLTADLPGVGPNLGLEAITWIPDSYLTANNFFDEHTGVTYNPANYANHGTGLFFVGVEGTGNIHAYALDQTSNAYVRVATLVKPFVSIMELQFDRDLNQLWAVCDNTCNGEHAIMQIDPATGKFFVATTFARPTGMPNYNNEGFAIGAVAECVSGKKPVYWADDTEDLGVSIRSGNILCATAVGPAPVVPEFPFAIAPVLVAGLLAAGVSYTRKRTLRLI
jgi:hypothetical protein